MPLTLQIAHSLFSNVQRNLVWRCWALLLLT
jgi:hypothetical protein